MIHMGGTDSGPWWDAQWWQPSCVSAAFSLTLNTYHGHMITHITLLFGYKSKCRVFQNWLKPPLTGYGSTLETPSFGGWLAITRSQRTFTYDKFLCMSPWQVFGCLFLWTPRTVAVTKLLGKLIIPRFQSLCWIRGWCCNQHAPLVLAISLSLLGISWCLLGSCSQTYV